MLLEISGLTKKFGGLLAVHDLSMNVKKGEIVGLIGPNGAGKSTVFNLVTGFNRPTSGKIVFCGKDITGMKPHLVSKLGIGRSFQLNPLFDNFTVLENITASFHIYPKSSVLDAFFNTPKYKHNRDYISERSLEILELVGLSEVKYDLAKNIPHGYQKMLGIARSLAINPKLILLDEPIAGMNQDEIDFTMEAIRKTQERGITIILVEHNMQVMDLCDRIVVINFGCKIAEGIPEEMRENEEVIEAYFGSGYDAEN